MAPPPLLLLQNKTGRFFSQRSKSPLSSSTKCMSLNVRISSKTAHKQRKSCGLLDRAAKLRLRRSGTKQAAFLPQLFLPQLLLLPAAFTANIRGKGT
ncbi:uncharacterized [Tachysurus ichikawai]